MSEVGSHWKLHWTLFVVLPCYKKKLEQMMELLNAMQEGMETGS
jgi:hypothetical protein